MISNFIIAYLVYSCDIDSNGFDDGKLEVIGDVSMSDQHADPLSHQTSS